MMNKPYAILLLSMLYVFTTQAQQSSQVFPDMETHSLNEETIVLPTDIAGKHSLLGLAFSRKSEDDLLTWFNPVYEKFIGDKSGTLTRLFAEMTYNLNVYFVPMFTGINTPATKPAMKKALEKIDPRLHPHILFYKGQLKPYKEALDLNKRDIPYIFVVDEHGRIIFTTSGSFSADKMRRLEKSLE